MVAEKVGRGGLSALLKAQTRTHAPMDSETFKSLAGRPRWLYEMATGEVAGDATHEPRAPLNPSGNLGHDHSGPPYGSALQHPIFSFSGTEQAADFTYNNDSNNLESVMYIQAGVEPSFVADVYVRPFSKWDGAPYSRAYMVAGIAGTDAGDITVEMWNDWDPTHRESIQSISTTTFPPQTVLFPHAYWTLRPGRNRLYGKFTNYSGTSAVIYSVSGNQLVKRSHNPGIPILDFDANELTAGSVTSWTNRGKLGGALATGTAPEAFASGGPESTNGRDAYVRFDSASSEYLTMSFDTRATGTHFGAIMRWVTTSVSGYAFDGNDTTNRNALFETSGGNWAHYAGTQVNSGTPNTSWVRVVGRFGTDGVLRVNGTDLHTSSVGTGVLDGLTVGARFNASTFGNFELARLMFWDDESDVGVIDRWLAERYPSIY